SRIPREELLLSVKSNDEPRLLHALQHSGHEDLNLIFKHPDSCTLLHIATLNNSPSIAKILLDNGASPNIRDLRGKKFSPLHYAAQIGSPEMVRILLENGADVNMKEGEFGRTCLHILTSKWKRTAEDNFNRSLDELLKTKKIKIDRQDNSNATPLFLAAQKGWEYMVKALIYKGASLETSVGLKNVKEVIDKKLPGVLETINYNEIEKIQRCYGDDLYEALKEENIDLFKDILNEINEKEKESKKLILEEDHGEYTLLNYACDHGLQDFVDILLREGSDPTRADKTTLLCPILYAAKNGCYKVMESLTENMKKIGILKQGALKAVDRKRETALHKVVKREQPIHNEGVDYLRCLQILLNLKGYINIDAQDDYNSTPLHYAVLCDDQSFVRYLLINGAHLGIKNKFGTLAITRIQPSVLEEVLNDCVKFKNNITDRDFEIILHYSMLAPTSPDYKPETDCLKFLSGSRPHRHLLRHPIIDTFLFLKWQRIRHYYFINLLAYSIFLALLTTYILLFFGTINKTLLQTDVATGTANATNSDSIVFPSESTLKLILQILILVFWIFGVMREMTQFIVSWKTYVRSLENWLEVSILVMTLLVLFFPIPYISLQGISAWLILSSWVELVLILGRHPLFAVYITMFTTVTFNFLKFILMFSFVIIAFSLSFYLVFQIDDNFVTYPKTLLKTIAMSTGEIEYTELPLSDFPISSHLLFVIFVFLIVLVLMNLLNGLAVSDIQLIQQEAEIVSYRSRVELISYIESVFLVNPYNKQYNGGRLCELDNCCFRACIRSSNPALRLLNYLGRRTLMFCNCLREHRITMFPNRGKDRWHVCSCHSFQLEESQIEAAKSVVLAEEGRVADRLAGLESRVDSVISAIRTLSDLIQKKEIKVNPIE
ncbi:Transient receptor potential cation channel protein painless, partial [Armadillidium nasatum]